METLFIPETINIKLTDNFGEPFRQENILLGIQTYAAFKNNVDIYPFTSDKEGHISLTREQIKNRADIFISYGIMDYSSIEYAKPNITIYFWGTDKLEKCISYWSMLLRNKRNRKPSDMEIKLLGPFEKEFAEITNRETHDLQIFSSCFNRTTKQKEDIILVADTWDKSASEKFYKLSLSV